MELDDFVSAFTAWTAAHRESHTPFIAFLDGTPVGMAWLAVVERMPGPGRWRRRSGLVQSVYVVPEARNRGAGTMLMRGLIDRAASLQLDYLGLHATGTGMAFYQRLGFIARSNALEFDLRSR